MPTLRLARPASSPTCAAQRELRAAWPSLRVALGWLFALLAWSTPTLAASVNLAWDAVQSTTVRGYMVYYVPSASGTLTQPVQPPAARLDVGNSTSYTLANLTPGTAYRIAVTAYDAAGGESGFSNAVTYTPPLASVPPVAQFTASATSGAAPLAMNFVNESTGTIASHAWTFGDGTTSTAANPTKVYSAPGTYTVSLRVTGPAGSNTLTRTGYITVNAPPPTGGSTETVLLTRDFADGSLAGWRVHDDGTSYGASRWVVSNGELAQLNETYGGSTAASDLSKPGTYLLYEAGTNWTDYRLKFRMRGADDDAMGVMFRYGDGNNYYRFSWDKQRSYRRLVKKVGGTFTLLASDAVPYEQNRNYSVEIVVQGTLIEVWIDGARIFRVTDSSRPRGSFAFYSWGQSGVYFDNVTVTAPAPASGGLLSKDFNDGSLAGWRAQDDGLSYQRSRWVVSGGELAQLNETYGGSTATSDLAKPGTYLLYEGGTNWTDYRARFRMRGADDDAMGIMFRYGDGNNYYRFSWDKQRAYRRLVKKVGGTFTLLASDAVPYVLNRNYDVEIVVQGTVIEVWIDGARIFRVTDSSRPRGSIAFYTWAQSGAYFDNLTVR